MKKRMMVISLVMLAVIGLGISAVSAQGNGNGAGQGNGGQPANTCADGDTQCQAFNYGGIGFVNGQTGARWNDQERGNMRNNGNPGTNGIGLYAVLPPASDTAPSEAEIAAMIDGWMDEQHAYAVYAAIMEQFGQVAPFANIQRSEAQHIAAWELLFDRYGVAIPAVPAFEMPAFASLSDACQMAAAAEVANFGLYDNMLETLSDYPDMVQVVTALRNASEFNHLPAFQNCAS
ncbi:MAG: DUF2202 domain-containing protein [Anaerolineae bacterium]|nr:DUF2202 domain-containing protein [Anaerolineae bacterium]